MKPEYTGFISSLAFTNFLCEQAEQSDSSRQIATFCDARRGKSDDELYPPCTEDDLAGMVAEVKRRTQ